MRPTASACALLVLWAGCAEEPEAWPEAPEATIEGHCDDGLDADGDGLLDCEDPDCWTSSWCPEDCADGHDNDGDRLIDCEDGDCASAPGCSEVCGNGEDDDDNGLVDCADPACMGLEECEAVVVAAVVLAQGGRVLRSWSGSHHSVVGNDPEYRRQSRWSADIQSVSGSLWWAGLVSSGSCGFALTSLHLAGTEVAWGGGAGTYRGDDCALVEHAPGLMEGLSSDCSIVSSQQQLAWGGLTQRLNWTRSGSVHRFRGCDPSGMSTAHGYRDVLGSTATWLAGRGPLVGSWSTSTTHTATTGSGDPHSSWASGSGFSSWELPSFEPVTWLAPAD